MIREFWVENYLSIKGRQTVNFETKNKDDEWASVDCGGEKRINKIGVVYGANASGKSNLLFAIQNVFELLFFPRQTRTDLVRAKDSFALTKDLPTKMFVSFYADNIKYDYEISFSKEYILSEKMDWYPNKSKSIFYERNFVSENSQAEIKFGPSLNISSKTKDTFLQNTLNNHSVLSTYAKNSFGPDAQPIANLYSWMAKYVHEVNIMSNSLVDSLKSAEEDPKAKTFFLQMLSKADFNITNFYTETKAEEVSIKELTNGYIDISKDVKIPTNRIKVFFENKAENNSFVLDLKSQSQGTKKFLSNLIVLYRAITENHIFLLDEIDSELHDDLLLFYLNTFLMNSNGSQLIFTSHEASLLHEDLLNGHRDFVFFAEKNHDGAYSEYTRADAFGLHKNLSLYNSYRVGRLGAVPRLGSPILYLDDHGE